SHASDTTQHTPTVPYTLPLHDALPILGRLKRYKGVETAVRAMALARSTRPDVTLEIAGQGDDRIRLERLARALRQADAVRFLGLDRKSTRLNSSHDQTSYSVFCLKQKK